MCLSPRTIVNPSKYISLSYSDRYLMQVPCGHCAECQSTMSNQWYYRSWYEYTETINRNGYILFDCLTYRDKDLPRVGDFFVMGKDLDYPCFNHLDIRRFLQTLRQRVKRLGYNPLGLRYFIASEYGTSPNGTHRPHYHLLFFVTNGIPSLVLSHLISQVWKFGITDGVDFRGSKYVLSRCVIDSTCPNALRVCRYITKYVMKDCQFQKEINRRVAVIMRLLAEYAVSPDENGICRYSDADEWLETIYAARTRRKLLRYVNQFHRQSQHFGENALGDIDLNQLFEDGCLYMPDSKGIKIPVPLSTYYKRKLFYELVEYNGSRYWQLNELGKEYQEYRKKKTIDLLSERYRCVLRFNGVIDIDPDRLANYVYNTRGRIRGLCPETSTLEMRVGQIDLFNYCTESDRLQFGVSGVVDTFKGDSQSGYMSSSLRGRITLPQFIAKYCKVDEEREKELSQVLSMMDVSNKDKQLHYELLQSLASKFKSLEY